MDYSVEDIYHYLNTTENDTYPSTMLKNMECGAAMLARHIANNDKILLVVDDDCDGFTSSALLMNYLHMLFPYFVENNIQYYIHEGKKHGILNADIIMPDIALVIAPDSSSNEYALHEQLAQQGIDILILDHHKAPYYSQHACVINNQLDDYPTKSLSGVGIVYKFCKYLDEQLDVEYADLFLDLVALGITADVMSMCDYETRYLVSNGLEHFRNPLIKALYAKTEFSINKSGGLSPYNLAYYIAPFLNATARVGTVKEKTILFESLLEFKAYDQIASTKRGCAGQMESIVEQAARNCTNIKSRQTKERDTDYELIESMIAEQNLLQNKILLIQMEKGEPAIAGLIANLLVAKYHHPTLILYKMGDMWQGSARNDSRYGLEDFRQFMRDCDLVNFAEGHESAFGTQIANENIDKFIEYSNKALQDYEFSPVDRVDFIINANQLTSEFILDIGKLHYIWGQEISEPLIAIEHIAITNDNLSVIGKKEDTIKIMLPNGISLMKFGSTADEIEALTPDTSTGCVIINVLGVCNINNYNDQEYPQIIINEYEIVGRQSYYF